MFKYGSYYTMSIRVQNGSISYAVSPHLPPIIKTEFYFLWGNIKDSFAYRLSTMSLFSLNSLCSSDIRSDDPAGVGAITYGYDILL